MRVCLPSSKWRKKVQWIRVAALLEMSPFYMCINSWTHSASIVIANCEFLMTSAKTIIESYNIDNNKQLKYTMPIS